MKLNNIIQMNDWDIWRFLIIIFCIQLGIDGIIVLNSIGLQIPVLRQLLGFVFLTFIPGILILRALKLHKLGDIETLLYTIGLSIASLMLIGFAMNMIFPLFKVPRPIGIMPLFITINMVVSVLCVISYVRDRSFSNPSYINTTNISISSVLFFSLIPFLSIFGTYMMNHYHSNIFLMFLIIILASIPIFIVFEHFISLKIYPFIIFIVSISILYHSSLITEYLFGFDILHELYIANLVKINGIWDPTIDNYLNGMLSLVMLAPIYSIIMDVSITWIFKIIYPIFLSLVPLGLYLVFEKQTNKKIAFLASFFFMSFFVFYNELISSARQQVAELFLILLLLLIVDKNLDLMRRSLLFIIFGCSLILSHYGLSYLYAFSLIFVWIILAFSKSHPLVRSTKPMHGTHLFSDFRGRDNIVRVQDKTFMKLECQDVCSKTISSRFVLFFIIFLMTWYIYISSSSAFDAIVKISDNITSNIFSEFLSIESAQGLSIILSKPASTLHNISKYLQLIAQIFIFIGLIVSIRTYTINNFNNIFLAFSKINFLICIFGIALPYFSSAINTSRLYQITLVFLAPFCIIGGVRTFHHISRLIKISHERCTNLSLQFISVFLAVFMLFNTGCIYEILNDIPTSRSLNSSVNGPFFEDHDVFSAEWLINKKIGNYVYADLYKHPLLYSFEGDEAKMFPVNFADLPEKSYIYFSRFNIIERKLIAQHYKGITEHIDSGDLIKGGNKIYDNSDSQVYYL